MKLFVYFLAGVLFSSATMQSFAQDQGAPSHDKAPQESTEQIPTLPEKKPQATYQQIKECITAAKKNVSPMKTNLQLKKCFTDNLYKGLTVSQLNDIIEALKEVKQSYNDYLSFNANNVARQIVRMFIEENMERLSFYDFTMAINFMKHQTAEDVRTHNDLIYTFYRARPDLSLKEVNALIGQLWGSEKDKKESRDTLVNLYFKFHGGEG